MLFLRGFDPHLRKFASPACTAACLIPSFGQRPAMQRRNGHQRRLMSTNTTGLPYPRNSWSKAEYEQVVALRQKGSTLNEIAALTGRHKSSVARLLQNNGNRFLRGETRAEKRLWSPEEDMRLEELRARKLRLRDIAGHFPGRTITALKERCKNLGSSTVSRRHATWSDYETGLLRHLGIELKLSHKEIHDRMPHRSRIAISNKLISIKGPPKPENSNRYTEEDDALIAGLKAAGKTWTEMVEYLPGRSSAAIRSRYLYKKWTGQ